MHTQNLHFRVCKLACTGPRPQSALRGRVLGDAFVVFLFMFRVLVCLGEGCMYFGIGIAMEPVASPETQSCPPGDSKKSLKGHATGPPGKLVYCTSSFIQGQPFSWQQVFSGAK